MATEGDAVPAGDGHVRIDTVAGGRRLVPAKVTPFCERCRVPWPCPSAALAEQLAAGGKASEGQP